MFLPNIQSIFCSDSVEEVTLFTKANKEIKQLSIAYIYVYLHPNMLRSKVISKKQQ